LKKLQHDLILQTAAALTADAEKAEKDMQIQDLRNQLVTLQEIIGHGQSSKNCSKRARR
jgi:hypothetical protein